MQTLTIERRDDGRLFARKDNGKESVEVQPRKCFPWTEPGHFISLRTNEQEEFAIIEDVDSLDEQSRQAVEAGLSESAFVFEVTHVESITAEFEIRAWIVDTKQGSMKFQTKLDEWPSKTPEGDLIVRDISSNLYLIRQPQTMNEHSRKALWAYLD